MFKISFLWYFYLKEKIIQLLVKLKIIRKYVYNTLSSLCLSQSYLVKIIFSIYITKKCTRFFS